MSRSESSRPRSIFLTIIVLMSAAMSALVAGFAVFHVSFAERTQRRDHQQFLTTTLQFIRAEMEGHLEEGESEATELAEIAQVIGRENATNLFGRLIVVVSDDRGESLLATEGAEALLRFDPPFPHMAGTPGEAVLEYWESPDGRHYVLSGFQARVATGERRTARIALDWTGTRHRVVAFRRSSAAAAMVFAVLAALAAAVVTRHALRPLAVIRDAAETIRRGSLGGRLDAAHLPAELSDVAESFQGMQQHLSESFERLSQFAGDLAHELRTPLNNLMGETEVALSRPRTAAEYEEVLASNLEEMGRLSRVIDSLLFLARASRAGGAAETEILDLAAESDSVIEYHQAQAEEKAVVVRREGTAVLRANRALLRRALSNVLANALDASSPGGAVLVRIFDSAGTVQIAVVDGGFGIPQQDLPRVFERFHRSQEARRQRPEGSGLGLAIVKSIVELHGGNVSLESCEGKGTTVTFSFPRA